MANAVGVRLSRYRMQFSGYGGLVPLFILAHFFYHVIGGLLSPLLPSIREEFGLSYTQTGFLLSAFSLTTGFANLPAGWLADRIGQRLLITITLCGVGVAGLLIGVAPSYVLMVAFLIFLGAIGGGYHVSAPPLITASVKQQNHGAALGLHMIGGTGSLFIAPLVAVAVASVWGWRSPYIVVSVPVFAFGLVFYVLLGRRLAGQKVKQAAAKQDYGAPSAETAIAPPAQIRWKTLLPFLVLSVLGGALMLTPVSFLPLFLTDKFAASQVMVGVLVSIVPLGGLIFGPMGGYLSDRLGPVRVTVIIFLVGVPLILLLNAVPYGLALGAVLVSFGILMTTRIPVSESFIMHNVPQRARSVVLGVFYFGSSEVGGVLTPVIGKLIDTRGFVFAFNVVAFGMLAVTLICGVWLLRSGHLRKES